MNTNCLEGIRCPKCGAESRFFISGECDFIVTDEGSEADGDHYWDDDSYTHCADCDHGAALRNFYIKNQEAGVVTPPKPPAPGASPETPPEDLLKQYGENDLP